MNPAITNLVTRANKIAALAISQNPKRKRYPQELKSIIYSLVHEHKLSTLQITNSIPISNASVRVWSGKANKKKISFKKVQVEKRQNEHKIFEQIRLCLITLIIVQSLGIALTLFLH